MLVISTLHKYTYPISSSQVLVCSVHTDENNIECNKLNSIPWWNDDTSREMHSTINQVHSHVQSSSLQNHFAFFFVTIKTEITSPTTNPVDFYLLFFAPRNRCSHTFCNTKQWKEKWHTHRYGNVPSNLLSKFQAKN